MAKQRHRTTLREVWQVFLTCESPERALAELKRLAPSRSICRKAVNDLQDAGKTNTVLLEFITQSGWSFEPISRRPKVSDTRVYSVLNQTSGGGPFVRIPVTPLGVGVGDEVRATFLPGKITLETVRA